MFSSGNLKETETIGVWVGSWVRGIPNPLCWGWGGRVEGHHCEAKDGGYLRVLTDAFRARKAEKKYRLREANSSLECVLFPDVAIVNYSTVHLLRSLTKG